MIRRLHILIAVVFSIIGYSQQISGIVIEADSELPIPGATILLEEKSLGTNTDFDGKFTLNNVSDGDIITISSIRYRYPIEPFLIILSSNFLFYIYMKFNGYFNSR